MTDDKLPSVLYRPNGNSLSMERALKQIRGILLDPEAWTEDALNASLDDVNTMLEALK